MSHRPRPEPSDLVNENIAASVAETMQALTTPSRLRILGRLTDGPSSVGEIAGAVGMEPSAVSHQLRVLRLLGLVVGSRDGRQIIYSIHDEHVADLLREAMSHVEHLRLGLTRASVAERVAT